MEKKFARKNSRQKITGESKFVAEAQKAVVVVPIVLEVAEVEVPIAVRVPVDVRNTVVAIAVSQCAERLPFSPGTAASLFDKLLS